jgi:hypothetical protein
MAESKNPQTLGEQIVLLFQELRITSELIRDSLEAPIIALKSGRSPLTLRLEAPLAETQEYRITLEELLTELAGRLQAFRLVTTAAPNSPTAGKPSELSAMVPKLEAELLSWEKYRTQLHGLLKHLQLIQGESQLSTLGRRPIEEAWEKLTSPADPAGT